MSMTMQGEVVLNQQKDRVWALLNEPEVLRACIPGCETVERTSDSSYGATVRVKLGPVSARFRGTVSLSPGERPDSYVISGQGDGGIAGLARGGATVDLSDHAGGTLLAYDVQAQVSGKMMQMGARLINSVMRKMADEFFANFAQRLAEGPGAMDRVEA